MTSPKKNPQGRGGGAEASEVFNLSANGSAILASKSTASASQRARILEALRLRPQTTEDLRRIGIFQAPARVEELRDRFGYAIDTSRVTLVDRAGYSHPRAALYSLRLPERTA